MANLIKDFLFKKFVLKYTKLISSVNLKPKELILNPEDKCLCLCPHADDESIGMGGLLSIYPENFYVILLTDGRKGIKDKPVEEVIKLREEEFRCAMDIAKIKNYKLLKAQDKKLSENFDLFKAINIEEYDYIFIPNIVDQHPDHKAVSLLLERLINSGVKIKNNLKICFYEVWSTLGLVNAFVDISNNIDSKKNMLQCYKSQIVQKDYEYHALGLNQYRGIFKDKKYVEAFCILNLGQFKKMCEIYY